ncbi:MAG: hypothetical protein WAL63_13430, partial [Solirubrobacteraceae bacterium]
MPTARTSSASPSRCAAASVRRVVVGNEAAGWSSSPVDELGDRVDEPRAAHPDRLGVADHVERQRAVTDLHPLDRAVGGTHPAADLCRLERRPGGAAQARTRSTDPSAITP